MTPVRPVWLKSSTVNDVNAARVVGIGPFRRVRRKDKTVTEVFPALQEMPFQPSTQGFDATEKLLQRDNLRDSRAARSWARNVAVGRGVGVAVGREEGLGVGAEGAGLGTAVGRPVVRELGIAVGREIGAAVGGFVAVGSGCPKAFLHTPHRARHSTRTECRMPVSHE